MPALSPSMTLLYCPLMRCSFVSEKEEFTYKPRTALSTKGAKLALTVYENPNKPLRKVQGWVSVSTFSLSALLGAIGEVVSV